jgi:DNA-binding transcriptional MerR regulator
VSADEARYGIDELAELGGVSRRTVRYYIQEGLLPAPFGLGRGDHYGAEHLQALLRVKSLQEAGRSLDEIRRPAARQPRGRLPTLAAPFVAPPVVATWRRVDLAPGVELHVSATTRLPNALALEALAEWCRTHLACGDEDPHADD